MSGALETTFVHTSFGNAREGATREHRAYVRTATNRNGTACPLDVERGFCKLHFSCMWDCTHYRRRDSARNLSIRNVRPRFFTGFSCAAIRQKNYGATSKFRLKSWRGGIARRSANRVCVTCLSVWSSAGGVARDLRDADRLRYSVHARAVASLPSQSASSSLERFMNRHSLQRRCAQCSHIRRPPVKPALWQ